MSWQAIWDQLVAYGPLGMFAIAIADTAFLPTAQAVDLLVLVQAAAAPRQAPLLLACMVAGSVAGALILWGIARSGGSLVLRRSVKEESLEKVRRRLRKYDAAALIVPTFLPIPFSPMKIFIFVAGALGIGPVRTAVAIAIGRVMRYGLLIGLGVWLGDDAWPLIKQHAGLAIAVVLALLLLFFVLRARRSAEPA
jgi:membrane protein YqaA with SNARE-associated domain